MILLTVKMHDRVGDESDFVEIYLSEVNYIDLWDRTKNSTKVLAFHTSTGSYLAITTLSDIAAVWRKYGFDLVGKSTVVNSSRVESIKTIDHNGSIIKFVDGSHISVRKQI
ncbi:LytTr DNA-binding domain protein [compost metagenome]